MTEMQEIQTRLSAMEARKRQIERQIVEVTDERTDYVLNGEKSVNRLHRIERRMMRLSRDLEMHIARMQD